VDIGRRGGWKRAQHGVGQHPVGDRPQPLRRLGVAGEVMEQKAVVDDQADRRAAHARHSASSRRKDSTSVTRPRVWEEPRSASLVTTAGLMSTQTVFTTAGSRLPVAMAW